LVTPKANLTYNKEINIVENKEKIKVTKAT